jgi:hypothetical protein
MFAKALLPRPADWADEYRSTKGYNDWEKHSGKIPKALRERLVGVTFANYRSENPLPVLLAAMSMHRMMCRSGISFTREPNISASSCSVRTRP